MRSTTGLFAMTLTAAGLVLMPAAYAQDKSPAAPATPAAPGTTTAPTTIPDAKLDKAAAAVKRVSAIKDSFDQKLAQAPATEKQRIAGEANEAMTKAVTEQGLSVEEYTTIIQMAQNDVTVRNKLLQRMK
jgi:hypothetical protein